MAEPQRKAPRWTRTLRFEADDTLKGAVTDLSAVGMKLVCGRVRRLEVGPKEIPGTLTFENGAHVRIKVKIVRIEKTDDRTVVGLEISEADKSFYDALPRLRKDTGETPVAKE